MKLGPASFGRPSTQPPATKPVSNHRQEQALQQDIEQAKLRNTVTLGRQALRSSEPEEQKPPTRPALTSNSSNKSAPTLEVTEQNFLTSFGENLSPEESRNIMEAASSSLQQLKMQGKEPNGAALMAAHTYNYSKKTLQESLPRGTSLSEARSLANSHPEVAGKLALLDSASAFLKQLKQKQAAPEQGQKKGAITPEAVARIQAERLKTLLEVNQGWRKVFAEIQKSAAERYKLAADTSQDIADIYRRIHLKQAKAHADHAKKYVYLLTEVWPES